MRPSRALASVLMKRQISASASRAFQDEIKFAKQRDRIYLTKVQMGRCRGCKCFIVRCICSERCRRCARLQEAEEQKDLERIRKEGSVSRKAKNEGSVPQTTENEGSVSQKTEHEGSVPQKTENEGSVPQKTENEGSVPQKTENKSSVSAPAIEENATVLAEGVESSVKLEAVSAMQEEATVNVVQEAATVEINGVNDETKVSALKKGAVEQKQATAQSVEEQTPKPKNIMEIFEKFVDPKIAGLHEPRNPPCRMILDDESDLSSSDDDDEYEYVTGAGKIRMLHGGESGLEDGRLVRRPSPIAAEYEVYCAKTMVSLHNWGFGPDDMLGYLRATRIHDPIKHYGSSTSKGPDAVQEPHFLQLQMLHRMKSMVRLMEWGFTMEQVVEYLELTTIS